MIVRPSFPYRIALTGFLGLFALLLAWNTRAGASGPLPVSLMLLITISPLLLPMRGFLKEQAKSTAWLAYVSLIYFTHGCAEAYASVASRYFALLEIALSLMIFFGATFYIRLLKASAS